MRLTCLNCACLLIVLGISAAVYAFTGFNLLYFLCFKIDLAYNSFLAICGVSALFLIYALIVFKPFKRLK